MSQIVCPVAMHPGGVPLRLVARSTEGGVCLPSGPGSTARAAAQLLLTACGVETRAAVDMGHSDDISEGARWHFALCRVAPDPIVTHRARWRHVDVDGRPAEVLWMPLIPSDAADVADMWSEADAAALDWIRATL